LTSVDSSAPKLHVIVASVRRERAGRAVADWFAARARVHAGFDVEIVDLREVNLPLLDEPKHPRLRQYQFGHTKAWSASVAAADAFVFVTPEYNHGAPPALINAFDYVYVEWNYKPAGFVSYGGVSGGTRSVQMAKPIVSALKMVPLVESVTIPFFTTLMEGSVFKGGEPYDQAAVIMLDELLRWSTALGTLRS
jgi:NAD(P)H-dependent FMN reductase